MDKRELLKEFDRLCLEKNMSIQGVYENSTKDHIQNAIDCLNCDDDTLNEYFTVIKLRYPNTHRTIAKTGNFKRHSHNRLFVYDTARRVLNNA